MASYQSKLDSREAWMKRLKMYWNSYSFPAFITRPGEIYEIDFGMNVGTEFSGRHLAICLESSSPSQEKMLVIPITTKFEDYNISKEDIIEVPANNVDEIIHGGVVIQEAKWISKRRIFRVSKILKEPEQLVSPVKGYLEITEEQLTRWTNVRSI